MRWPGTTTVSPWNALLSDLAAALQRDEGEKELEMTRRSVSLIGSWALLCGSALAQQPANAP